ncbi:MAG: hypothetical protein ACKV19_07575 [Verrucomicrobiales bacterium]
MNRRRSLATLMLLAALHALVPLAHAQKDPAFDQTARSLVRLDSLSRQLAVGIARQVAERGIVTDDSREEIAIATAESLHRATSCLKRRFFDGAECDEIEERLLEIDELADRVQASGSRLGLYGYLREKLAAYLNERDWLKRHLGVDRG